MRNELLTATEVGARWGVSPNTLANWRSVGRGPRFLKLGAKVRYEQSEVERFESEQRRTSTAK